MCGICGKVGSHLEISRNVLMQRALHHRGPDMRGHFSDDTAVWLGHTRLSILDLSADGRQPMQDPTGRYTLLFNGEIYNFLELRQELQPHWTFVTQTDTEVLLSAFVHWGVACLDRLLGMFAFAIWDAETQQLFAARDRFGVKPFYYGFDKAGAFCFASEIKALHAGGIPAKFDTATWAAYLGTGMYDHSDATFWRGINSLPPGHWLTYRAETTVTIQCWYDAAEQVLSAGEDTRSEEVISDELIALLEETVRLRFRADVPVGVCLSGGLDSSLLLALIVRTQGKDVPVNAFTFYCDDPRYDELPWVRQMLAQTPYSGKECLLTSRSVPELAQRVQKAQDEPYGGLPTLGMAEVHRRAKEQGVVVLLDGSGLDEGWCGYDYYPRAEEVTYTLSPVQGSVSRSTRPECLEPGFCAAAPESVFREPFGEKLRDLQYRDLRYAKIPRAMRFADRVSMLHSRELREPFLDHRLIELGLRQPAANKLRDGQGKWLIRHVAKQIVPFEISSAPKRPVQTPQREWLRNELQDWATDCIETMLHSEVAHWFQPDNVRAEWQHFLAGAGDNSFPFWQWINLGIQLTGE